VRDARVRSLGHVQSAVVRREDHNCLLSELELIELHQKPAHGLVECFNHGRIYRFEGARVRRDAFRRGFVGNVRAVVGQIEQERSIAVVLDETLREARECKLGLASFRRRGRGVGSGRMDDVETVLRRTETNTADVPLANRGRHVARLTEIARDGLLAELDLLLDGGMQHFLRG